MMPLPGYGKSLTGLVELKTLSYLRTIVAWRSPTTLASEFFCSQSEFKTSAAVPSITLLDYSILSSQSLTEPHGIAFLDNDHVIACNRAADACVFRIPVPGDFPRERSVRPVARIKGNGILSARVLTPGSVDCHALAENCYRCLVCNNDWNAVTSHSVSLGHAVRVRHDGILRRNSHREPAPHPRRDKHER
jgi:hypothetical protein